MKNDFIFYLNKTTLPASLKNKIDELNEELINFFNAGFENDPIDYKIKEIKIVDNKIAVITNHK